MLALPMGIITLIFTLFLIKKEPRRFHNAVALMTAIVLIIHGTMMWFQYYKPSLVPEGKGKFALTPAGELSSGLYLLFLFLVFIVGIALIINGFMLIKKESFSLSHTLPILFGILCIALVVIYFVYIFYHTGRGMLDFIVSNIIAYLEGVAIYVPLMFVASLSYSFIYRQISKSKKPEYVVVLGASLIGEEVSPLLAKRLDKAIEIFQKNDSQPIIITSGGQGNNEVVSEAFAMKKYLLEKKIPEDKIRMEDKSVNTYQNMKFSKQIVEQELGDAQIQGVFTTNNFHVLRSAIIAHTVGLKVDGIGCKTAGYYYPAASIREAIAFIFGYKKVVAAYMLILLLYCLIDMFFPRLAWILW